VARSRNGGAVRASSNITGAEAAREILQAANIRDVNVSRLMITSAINYDPTQKRLCPFQQRLQHAIVAALGIAATRRVTRSSMPKPTRH